MAEKIESESEQYCNAKKLKEILVQNGLSKQKLLTNSSVVIT